MNKHQLTTEIKREAMRLGFDSCGISKAEKLDAEAVILEAWLNQNRHGKMAYMANYFDKRIDPRLLVLSALRITITLIKSSLTMPHNWLCMPMVPITTRW